MYKYQHIHARAPDREYFLIEIWHFDAMTIDIKVKLRNVIFIMFIWSEMEVLMHVQKKNQIKKKLQKICNANIIHNCETNECR